MIETKLRAQRSNDSSSSMKKSSSRNSDSSVHSHMESPHSPLRFHSPLRSDAGDPMETPPYASPDTSPEKLPDNSKAIVVVDVVDKSTQFSPLPSPYAGSRKPLENVNFVGDRSTSSKVMFNRAMKEEVPQSVTKVGPAGVGGVENGGGDGGGGGGGGGGGRSPVKQMAPMSRRSKDDALMKAALGFRVCEVAVCLISFSVMASDKTQGWSGDSFDRYKEYRYCLTVNIIAFVYAAFQAFDLVFTLIKKNHMIRHQFRCYFDFFMDQVLAYLLISSSSSAATRVDDWQSNWGKDEFTQLASASVSMSFLAFVAFAFSSLISGYNLCTRDPA
ncbi:CASP-like protein 4A2 [Cucumis melo var. makuwa]|uniref:CASP-like protein n=2 Tax=Cucumis melo TaxID=3656 RepID=A0A1S3BWI9_CUCME|nr:CASP-like protein 4A2 [Cucumis melo]KAA0057869.1 CASP-like protein 4A2 [Cucumis melo var. makuwa]TYJ98559.1 CASP-like protein 4A2 [Cucumis melo var. makuwa]